MHRDPQRQSQRPGRDEPDAQPREGSRPGPGDDRRELRARHAGLRQHRVEQRGEGLGVPARLPGRTGGEGAARVVDDGGGRSGGGVEREDGHRWGSFRVGSGRDGPGRGRGFGVGRASGWRRPSAGQRHAVPAVAMCADRDGPDPGGGVLGVRHRTAGRRSATSSRSAASDSTRPAPTPRRSRTRPGRRPGRARRPRRAIRAGTRRRAPGPGRSCRRRAAAAGAPGR